MLKSLLFLVFGVDQECTEPYESVPKLGCILIHKAIEDLYRQSDFHTERCRKTGGALFEFEDIDKQHKILANCIALHFYDKTI